MFTLKEFYRSFTPLSLLLCEFFCKYQFYEYYTDDSPTDNRFSRILSHDNKFISINLY